MDSPATAKLRITKMNNRHFAIMELLMMNPKISEPEIAEKLGYTPSRVSVILNSPVFQLAFSAWRRQHQEKISDLMLGATERSVRFLELMRDDKVEGEKVEIPLRAQSARDIIDQGWGKAVEKRASLNATAEVPVEDLQRLIGSVKEISEPFTPTRFLRKAEEGEDEQKSADV